MFKLIDRNEWKREPYFKHFFNDVRCTYSMTVNLEITHTMAFLKEKNLKLFPVLIHALASVVNRHEEFRTSFNDKGEVGIWDHLDPCYTIFHPESETFSSLWTPFDPELNRFAKEFSNDIECYGKVEKLEAKPNTPPNSFPVSMIPWTSFTGFNLNIFAKGDYLLPIFTFGRFFKEGEKTFIPFSLQVHHAVCDGFHASRLINELQVLLNELG